VRTLPLTRTATTVLSGSTAAAIVQHAAGTTTGSTITATFSKATTAGNTLIALVSTVANGESVYSVTIGGKTDNWRQDAQNLSFPYVFAWRDSSCAGGQTAVVVTLTGADDASLDVFEVSGLIGNPLDEFASASAGAAPPAWSTGSTPGLQQAGEMAFGVIGGYNGAGSDPTITPAAGWNAETTLNSVLSAFQTSAWQLLTSDAPAAYSGTSNIPSGDNNYTALIVCYQALPGAGSGTAQLGPVSPGEVWYPQVVSVGTDQAEITNEAQCKIYVGDQAIQPNYVDGTLSGSTGDSTSNAGGQVVHPGEWIWAEWTGGDAGATAFLNIQGTRTVP